MSESLPQPGWFEDPRREADLRWWDGTAWTAHTAARPTIPAPPSAPVAPPPAATPPTGPGPAGSSAAPPPATATGDAAETPARVVPPSAPGGQPTIEIAGTSHTLAGWWPRAVAYVIDSLIRFAFLIPAIVIAVVIGAGIDWQAIDLQSIQDGQTVDGRIPGLSAADTAKLGAAIIVVLAWWLVVELTYQPMTMARRGANNGRTWGMQAMGIRVVRNNGQAMTYGPALVREFLVMGLLYGLISTVGNAVTVVGGTVIVLVFYLWPLWDAQNRAAQDFICSTHVVDD
ncbi:MAG: RDD family protein [Solirubrobacterales bacterium]